MIHIPSVSILNLNNLLSSELQQLHAVDRSDLSPYIDSEIAIGEIRKSVLSITILNQADYSLAIDSLDKLLGCMFIVTLNQDRELDYAFQNQTPLLDILRSLTKILTNKVKEFAAGMSD